MQGGSAGAQSISSGDESSGQSGGGAVFDDFKTGGEWHNATHARDGLHLLNKRRRARAASSADRLAEKCRRRVVRVKFYMWQNAV